MTENLRIASPPDITTFASSLIDASGDIQTLVVLTSPKVSSVKSNTNGEIAYGLLLWINLGSFKICAFPKSGWLSKRNHTISDGLGRTWYDYFPIQFLPPRSSIIWVHSIELWTHSPCLDTAYMFAYLCNNIYREHDLSVIMPASRFLLYVLKEKKTWPRLLELSWLPCLGTLKFKFQLGIVNFTETFKYLKKSLKPWKDLELCIGMSWLAFQGLVQIERSDVYQLDIRLSWLETGITTWRNAHIGSFNRFDLSLRNSRN